MSAGLEDWEALRARLGGALDRVPVEGEDDGRVAFGVSRGLVWSVIGQADRVYVIEVDTVIGGAVAAVRADLVADPSLVAALAAAGGPVADAALGVRPELVQLQLVGERGGLRVNAGVGPVLEALVAATLRHVTLIETGCWGCGAPDTPVGRPFGQTVRLCATCQEATRIEEAALDEKAAADGADPESEDDEALFQAAVLQGVDHEALRQEGLRLERVAEAGPALFRAALVGWVLAGQALLASGAVLVASVVVALLFVALGLVLSGRALAVLLMAKLLVLKLWKWLVFAAIAIAAAGRTAWAALRRRYGEAPVRQGVRLTRADAPKLYAWLDGLAGRVSAPLPEVVFVDMALNASAGEHLDGGRWRRVVTVGVPFLELFSVRELEAIMAHELGHLRHDDARELWVFRTVDAWRRAVLGSHGVVGRVVIWAAGWYLPRFLVRAQVVSRHRERAADTAALGVAPAELQARALVRIGLVGDLLERALRIATRRAIEVEGEVNPYDGLWDALIEVPDAVVQEAYRDALEAPTQWLDSHPGLRERLAALDLEPPDRVDLAPDGSPRAFEVVDHWDQVRDAATGTQRRVALLQVERARRGERKRLQRLTAVEARLEAEPDHAPAHVIRARLLSAGDADDAALVAYARALELDPSHDDARREQVHLLLWTARNAEAGEAVDALLALGKPTLEDRQFAAEVWARAGRLEDAVSALRAVAEDEELPAEFRAGVLQRAQVLWARSAAHPGGRG